MGRTADFDYELPTAAIAQTPVEPRDAARLLVDTGVGAAPEHRLVRDLPSLLEPGDLLVVNTTRVLPARLKARRATGGAAEVLLLEPVEGALWEALVRPSAKLGPGTALELGEDLTVVVGADLGDGRRHVELVHPSDLDLLEVLGRYGEVPLPPYIATPLDDPERYQTTYADRPGSVAAPTAGLHLTPGVLDAVRARGIEVAERRIMPEELNEMSECFITGSAAEVTAVAEIAHWNFNPGGITKTLMEDYTAEVQPKKAAA